MKKEVRLYNALFPIWMCLLFPQTWWLVLPGNFLIDSFVLLGSIYMWKNKWEFYKKVIFKIFGFGLLSDFLGSLYMLFLMFVLHVGEMGDEWYITIPAILISAFCIFGFNYYYTFQECEKGDRFKLAIIFAIATAPYTFLLPTRF